MTWAAIVSLLSKIVGPILKAFSYVVAYVGGKRAKEAQIVKKSVKRRKKADKAGKKLKSKLRDKSAGDVIRDKDKI